MCVCVCTDHGVRVRAHCGIVSTVYKCVKNSLSAVRGLTEQEGAHSLTQRTRMEMAFYGLLAQRGRRSMR